MPLIRSKSKEAFKKNIEAEMKSGKPQDQSLAIAYSVQRKGKKRKMADGGEVKSLGQMIGYPGSENDPAPKPSPNPVYKAHGGMIPSIMRKRKMADGGEVLEMNDDIDPASDFDEYSEEAAEHGEYDLDQLEAQPEGSNEHGDNLSDEDAHDMVSALRKRIREKRGM